MDLIGILILEDDASGAVEQMLDSEGWQVTDVPSAEALLPALAKGNTRLVIANVARTGLDGPIFEILRELALAPSVSEGKMMPRVLFLVPASIAAEAQPRLEKCGVPFLLKPYHLHDFLEKVSDLLMEAGALTHPLRQVKRERYDVRPLGRRKSRLDHKSNTMFASREDYFMTEEELAEYERQEAQERERKRKKQPQFEYPAE